MTNPKLKFLYVILKHKYYVFKVGRKLNIPVWNLIKHDFSKLTPDEFPHYAEYFCGEKKNEEEFRKAWLNHQNKNKHHWEYWIMRSSHNKSKNINLIVDMPDIYVREMIADWVGAAWAYNGQYPIDGKWNFLVDNVIPNIIVSDNTMRLIKYNLANLSFFNTVEQIIERNEPK